MVVGGHPAEDKLDTARRLHKRRHPGLRSWVQFDDGVRMGAPGELARWREPDTSKIPHAHPALLRRFAERDEGPWSSSGGAYDIGGSCPSTVSNVFDENGAKRTWSEYGDRLLDELPPYRASLMCWHVISLSDWWQHHHVQCRDCDEPLGTHPVREDDGWVWSPVYPTGHVATIFGVSRAQVAAWCTGFGIDVFRDCMALRDLWKLVACVTTPGVVVSCNHYKTRSPPSLYSERQKQRRTTRRELVTNEVIGAGDGWGLVVREGRRRKGRHWEREVLCIACGSVVWRREDRLKSQKTTSCGCRQRDNRQAHYARRRRRRGPT